MFRKKLPISTFHNIIPNIQQPSHNKLRFHVKQKTSLKSHLKRLLFILFCVFVSKIGVVKILPMLMQTFGSVQRALLHYFFLFVFIDFNTARALWARPKLNY